MRFPDVDLITKIIIFIVALVFLLMIPLKVMQTRHYKNEAWFVESVNYGFCIVIDDENEHEILARNPVPNLQVGDQVLMQGFSYTGFLEQNLPYVHSKVK